MNSNLLPTRNLCAFAEQLANTTEIGVLVMRMQQSGALEKMVLQHRDGLTVILLKWWSNEQTEFHSHGESLGVLRVLAGVLREETLSYDGVVTKVLHPGEASAFDIGAIHRLSCNSLPAAVSLHIYTDANSSSRGGLAKVTEYDADESGNLLMANGTPRIARIRTT